MHFESFVSGCRQSVGLAQAETASLHWLGDIALTVAIARARKAQRWAYQAVYTCTPHQQILCCPGCRKDKQQSDSMEEACEAVQLPWLLKKAVLVLNTLEVRCLPFPAPCAQSCPPVVSCTMLVGACCLGSLHMCFATMEACFAIVAVH